MTFHRPAPCPVRRFVRQLMPYALNPSFVLAFEADGVRILTAVVVSRCIRLPFVATDRQRRAAVRLLQYLDRRSHEFAKRNVHRIDYFLEHYAPEVSDAEALDLGRPDAGFSDVLVVRFHSDCGLHDRRRAANPEPVRECRAYDTVRFGRIYGQTYALPCLPTGRLDRAGRRIFIDEAGEFVVGFEPGCPEYPAVGRIERPAY